MYSISFFQDTVIREQIVEALRSCAQQAARLLLQAKSAAVDPQAPNSRLQLATAARAVTESINRLIDICTAGAPWQKECDNALRNIQSCRHLLESPSAPINEYSYFECLDVVTDKSKVSRCCCDCLIGDALYSTYIHR